METKFYFCPICGNVVFMAVDSGMVPSCCGEEMILLEANTSDGAREKHVPVVEMLDEHKLRVQVGSELHPMTAQHHIVFICLMTTKGGIIRYLNEHKPDVKFCYRGKPLAVFAYCNLHGLWRFDIPEEMQCSKEAEKRHCENKESHCEN